MKVRSAVGMMLAVGWVACGAERAPEERRVEQVELVTHPMANRAPANASWVAFQDGESGAWTVLQGEEGRYAFEVKDPSGRYGVAIVCARESFTRGYVLHATRAELSSLVMRCPYSSPAEESRSVSGRLSGFNGAGSIVVTIPGAVMPGGATEDQPDYGLRAPAGEQRLMALRTRQVPGIFTGWVDQVLVSPVRLEADLQLDLDLERDGLPTEVHRVSLEGVLGEAVLQETRLHHPADLHRSRAPIVGRRWWGPEGFHDYGGIPLALQSEDDVHMAYAEAYFPGQNRGRTAERYFKAPRDITLELPPPLESVDWSIQGAGESSRFEARWSRAAGEASWYALSLWDEPHRYRQWSTLVTPGWLGEGAGWSYAVPSFQGLEGFSTAWGITPGTRVLGSVSAVYANRPLTEAVMLLDGPMPGAQVDGFEVRTASDGVLLEGE